MADLRPKDLFGKLNQLGYRTLDGAANFCRMRTNPSVELVHWLQQMLNEPESDLQTAVRHFGIDDSKLVSDLTAALGRLPRGAGSITGFGLSLVEAIEQGWIYASLMFKQNSIRGGHILIGCLKNPSLENALKGLSEEFRKLKADDLTDRFDEIFQSSIENSSAEATPASGDEAPASGGPPVPGRVEALAKFTSDLVAEARAGKIDPITGRDKEIRQITDILLRRRQNNPILTGEAGVGKTAVVEGLALKIAAGDVPPALKDVELRTLDLGALKAGASMRGEFEKRLKQVIEEVEGSPVPIILFIDEAHTLIGAGGQEGQGDAANLLKPALARGKLRTIAATTWKEYKMYFEKDNALERRFQPVVIEEPDEEKALAMLRGVSRKLSEHHGVPILADAMAAAVKFSKRYIPARQLPDKAVSLMDTAASRVSLSQHATPAEVDDCRKHIEALTLEESILKEESAAGADRSELLDAIAGRVAEARTRLESLEANWATEKTLVDELIALKAKLSGTADEPGREPIITDLRAKEAELAGIQKDKPLIHHAVTEAAVAAVVSDWTGIPVGRMVKDEIRTILNLADFLQERVIGQRHALEAIAKRIEISRAQLENPSRPIGVFMLAGTSGVGKTETALALAEALYGGEGNLISFNMTEFSEGHSVATFKGAPPGYKGYGEGGVLTEAVRRRPYSVVLLDEIEKAHPNVIQLFFQVFDKGRLDDSTGRSVDFRNTIILMTTNAGTELITNMCADPELMPTPEALAEAVRKPLLEFSDEKMGSPKFTPAFLGRVNVIPYYTLSDEVLRKIVELQLSRVKKRLLENRGTEVTFDPSVGDLIASRCTEVQSGARVVESILTQTLLPELSRALLEKIADGHTIEKIAVSTADGRLTYQFN
ncbi:type VI secretion system ATPase TssH [Luteolibacter sp. Populi]|uniref:type VI secretion system ATPase TssH n=1 Tax=Luteolibacter sp. Populi TaxID=3230487 RepID=UPI003466AE12